MKEVGSIEDACYGIGFCQGQDRAFQLELLLRIVRGRLAELVGAVGLPVDRLSRRIGFAHTARLQLPLLPADIRGHVEAYAAGVDAGRTLGLPRRPHEFFLLGARPTPWEAADSVALDNVLAEIRADALAASMSTEGMQPFVYREVVKQIVPGGPVVREFLGNGTFIKQLSRPVRHVAYIGVRHRPQ